MRGNMPDDLFDDGEDEQPAMGGEPFAPREPQPFYPREQQQPHQPHSRSISSRRAQQQHVPPPTSDADVDRLPSFITGGQPAPQPPQQAQAPTNSNGYDGQADRFPLHRRRRRHRGPRDHATPGDNDLPTSSGPSQLDD